MSDQNNEKALNYTRPTLSFNLTIILSIFYTIWRIPIVSLYMNTYIAMLLLVVLVLAVLFSSKIYGFKTGFVLSLGVFVVMMLIESHMKGITFLNNIWSVFLSVLPIFVGFVLVVNKKDQIINRIVPVIIISYLLTAITTYTGLAIFPDASRLLATGDDHYLTYFRYNIGGFDFVYSLTLLHPVIVGVLRFKKKPVWSLIFTLISGLCIFRSAYTMAALMFIISCLAYLLPVKENTKKAARQIKFFAFGLIFLFLIAPWVLDKIANWPFLSDSADKIQDIANILRGLETSTDDAESRRNLYMRSWESFLTNPVFGSFFEESGILSGHSLILDIMAQWGILGLSVVIILFIEFGKSHKVFAGSSPIYNFTLLSLMTSAILSTLNPRMWTYELGFALPLFIRYIVSSSKNS